MSDVSVTDLRKNLPAYLKKVKGGQRIRVTSRGEVIAELSSPKPSLNEAKAARALLRGSVLRYERPCEPALAAEEWDVDG